MRRYAILWLGFLWWLSGVSVQAAHTQARLLLAAETAKPGTRVMAGIQLRMDPRWHTYWRNSGDSGMPTEIQWQLPAGVTAGDIQWPPPDRQDDAGLVTYVYKDEVVLLVPLTLAANTPVGPLDIKAKVSWLECDTQCVPGKADVQASLNVGNETKASADAELIEKWSRRIPSAVPAAANLRAAWEGPVRGDSRSLVISWEPPPGVTQAEFFPYPGDNYEIQAATSRLPFEQGKLRLRKEVKKLDKDWPGEIAGVLVQNKDGEALAWEARLRPSAGDGGKAIAGMGKSLWQMLLYAFVGGLILNLMPCVLPVIALKILGFVSQAREHPSQVRRFGVIYGLGVLASFAGLAGLVLGLKAAGHQVSWGMQFSSPQFLVVLTVMVTLVALNLFGLFEVTLGGRVMDTAGNLASHQGSAGAFFNGVLTTVLATPCTAPILAIAIGFAFSPGQPALVTLAVFLFVGVGLALPYVLLSLQPAWLKFLPKPGPWMEKFKVIMGFPMLATAFWLFSLTPTYYGDRSWWLGIFLIIVALAAWIFGDFVQRGRTRRGLAAGMAVALLLFGYVIVVEQQLKWRTLEPSSGATAGAPASQPGGIEWQPWSPEAVAAARQTGRPILVDFTAKWCWTCNTLVKPALESASVRNRLREVNGIAFLGDYTRFPTNITAELLSHGRAGVPLVLVYPREAGAEPFVLPEALTPGMVLNALDRAAGPRK